MTGNNNIKKQKLTFYVDKTIKKQYNRNIRNGKGKNILETIDKF